MKKLICRVLMLCLSITVLFGCSEESVIEDITPSNDKLVLSNISSIQLNSNEEIVRRTEHSFDYSANGQLTKVVLQSENQAGKVIEDITRYVYHDSGRLEKIMYTSDEYQRSFVFEWDENERVTKIETYKESDELESYGLFEYSDPFNVRCSGYDKDGTFQGAMHFELDEFQNPIVIMSLDQNLKPFAKLNLQYDQQNNSPYSLFEKLYIDVFDELSTEYKKSNVLSWNMQTTTHFDSDHMETTAEAVYEHEFNTAGFLESSTEVQYYKNIGMEDNILRTSIIYDYKKL